MMYNAHERLQYPADISSPCSQAIEIIKSAGHGVGNDFFVIGRFITPSYQLANGRAAVMLTMDDSDIMALRDMCNSYLDRTRNGGK